MWKSGLLTQVVRSNVTISKCQQNTFGVNENNREKHQEITTTRLFTHVTAFLADEMQLVLHHEH